MSESATATRAHLRRQLEAHLTALGYSSDRARRTLGSPMPEIVRINPLRGRVVYGETVLHDDLMRPSCHERLLFFSQRRTRHRSSILFFIGVLESDEAKLEALLKQLDVRSGTRGGHVHIVPIAPAEAKKPRGSTRRTKTATSRPVASRVA